MARKSSTAPFKMKYTNGKKTDSTAFFQMANPPAAPNPAVDDAIKKQVDQKIAQKVDKAVTPEESSPMMKEGKNWKKAGKILKKVGQVAATSLSHGLDAVYGTGKIAADTTIFSESKEKENKSGKNEIETGLPDSQK